MKIYMCAACRFLFERVGAVTQCPDCGKERVRIATPDEQTEYHILRIEFGYESRRDKVS